MLALVLLLTVVAFGVLVGAVVASQPAWGWFAVLLSAVGGALLVLERLRRPAASSPAGSPAAEDVTSPVEPAEDGPAEPEADEEPEQERTDPSEQRRVAELIRAVLVIDERPRYHLRSCAWLGSQETISLPAREACELGFTPCRRCAPNAALLADDPERD